ncbi:phosphoribosylformylglycinamidine synthase II [Beijerinckia indica subsp. indica ATCC 9039]|uniref:Phosphoribosylformylglycinamidine synthase subunit PurL n=1 Tax=Beijerinckia indica subsp. indica (strain ATCC 9039 / DSM 1715 / NCIMB 8712) TaxID=395963 RepID=PURL_BEII9|nr:phosphoribosylformylglycinamidine synthase subunit PurL [Beijerinckia indica]B2IC83.1 RecName: Full=Phosphoribosylformylglycinamidine synthase subunit PurL; Short=FGAM synthase; AltName: Full=Formylglycinamide ribonucleotide amidotransferase subunit II; Short=FGAR amidotransferase II; Short=FGAR-AT II; AltName: Full=Glutamine amidotransferase PurL; AltName: Full=Phosphoribosylformylglycinamidine synthase subunit II [Beijerinckia indica subsp. indica ATCC 9039]ACB96680.1 phosphoribosylformylgly
MSADPPITPELVAAHGLKPDEYQRILTLIGREPSFTELGIFSAMWNEHCSYKSSRIHLRKLPTKAPWVIQGPGENAGVIDIGDGEACIFKMESHNHPSYIEPHQGAATGVGGILRDVFTMGARPVASLDLLRFGAPEHPLMRHLIAGVASGIGSYGNSFGVPTVGGSTKFDRRYNGNILVNAMAVGIARQDEIFYAKATGVGNPIVYLGSKTGRDGIHGATMASAAFEADAQEKRPTVQVGDPFAEKLLLEACLELMKTGAVIAIQDMGAAGLTSSAVEMGAKGNLGIELDLDAVPCREPGMSAYEMLLSESQERMLMVLAPEKAAEAEAVFRKWGLDFAIIGKTTDDLRFVIKHEGEIKADLPIKELGDEAPVYDRPSVLTPRPATIAADTIVPPISHGEALLRLIGSPDLASKLWITEQYDSLILGNTIQGPGGDAALIRLGDGPKGLALTADVTQRYCEADPYEGGKQAVTMAWRNLTAVGALPLAVTDNLNFGNPENPKIMGQFIGCLEGIGEACRALDFPIVSGNVSLYNASEGQDIPPTPAIGGVGLLEDASRGATLSIKRPGDAILLLGETQGWLGASLYLRDICGREDGAPPVVDLALEKRIGNFLRGLIANRALTAVHTLTDGGLAVGLAKMALAGGIGARIDIPGHCPAHAYLFGEDQARYLVTAAPEKAEAIRIEAEQLGIACQLIGRTGGPTLELGQEASVAIEDLRRAFEEWLPNHMTGIVIE